MARLFIRTPAFIKQSFTDLKNPAFRKILVFFIIAMIIPVTGVTYFSIRHSTENIVAQVRQSSINSLSDKKNILELRFSEFDKLCYQIFNNNDLNRSRRTPVLSFSHMDHLKNFLEYLSGLRFTNDLIDSIYVYDIGNNYILSGAKFSPEAFKDIEIIKLGMEREFGIVHRKLNGLDVISYIRNLSHVSYSHNLIIVINVNYNNLFNITQDRKNNFDTLIFDDSGSIVMLDSEILQTVPSGTINSIMSSSEESGIYYINETEYFICQIVSC